MAAELPDGFTYHENFISPGEEERLLQELANVQYKPFEFRGVMANRKVAHYGFNYEYGSRQVSPGLVIPEFLLSLRNAVAEWTGDPEDAFREVLLTYYPPGAGIGWHRDAPAFGKVVGVSLQSSCEMRFRRGDKGRTAARLTLAPRSAYVLDGAARNAWQHSIPAQKEPRYSITFRTIRAPFAKDG
jgi:alkylated DNA repair dioxygenase AlkB